VPASDCRADHKSGAHEYDIFDDVLAFERRSIRQYREDLTRKQKDGGSFPSSARRAIGELRA